MDRGDFNKFCAALNRMVQEEGGTKEETESQLELNEE